MFTSIHCFIDYTFNFLYYIFRNHPILIYNRIVCISLKVFLFQDSKPHTPISTKNMVKEIDNSNRRIKNFYTYSRLPTISIDNNCYYIRYTATGYYDGLSISISNIVFMKYSCRSASYYAI
jgi:hypothetical protein